MIFTGSDLQSANIEATIQIVQNFTSPNTLTVVFTKPNVKFLFGSWFQDDFQINQNNYGAVALVSNLVLVQYNQNKYQMVVDIRQAMNCH